MFKTRVIASLLVVFTLAILVAAGCVHPAAPPKVAPITPARGYVGQETCKGCHPKEFQDHHGTGHDLTLRFADAKSLSSTHVPIGPIRGTKYEMEQDKDSYVFRRAGASAISSKVEYAFGSGRVGMTFVSTAPDGGGQEFRMSLAPKYHSWYLTPGQERRPDDDLGAAHDVDTMTRCFGCHSVADSRSGVKPDPKFFGVSCESCHGSGGAHVAAMGSGGAELHIETFKDLTPRQINERCGICHRTINDVNLQGTEAAMTQRFQPYGIMQSPCFIKSGEAMSCLTCHDPHKNASYDEKDYVVACLKCHGSPKQTAQTAPKAVGHVCPVNATDKCIECHMPPRKVLPFSKMPVYMADHLIWAYGKKKPHASN